MRSFFKPALTWSWFWAPRACWTGSSRSAIRSTSCSASLRLDLIFCMISELHVRPKSTHRDISSIPWPDQWSVSLFAQQLAVPGRWPHQLRYWTEGWKRFSHCLVLEFANLPSLWFLLKSSEILSRMGPESSCKSKTNMSWWETRTYYAGSPMRKRICARFLLSLVVHAISTYFHMRSGSTQNLRQCLFNF